MITISLILLAGICKAISDVLADHFYISIFQNWGDWWNKSESWRYKWKAKETGERFPGSTTFFVFLTDGWHLFNMIQYTLIVLAIVLYEPLVNWWVDAIILKAVFTIVFEIFYRWILVKR